MTAVLARPALAVNERYVHVSAGLVQATRLPGGCWAVKVRQVGGVWLGFAVPLGDTAGSAFAIVCGPGETDVFTVAVRWADSARTLSGRMDRVVFAGHGDAIGEQPVDVEALAATCCPACGAPGLSLLAGCRTAACAAADIAETVALDRRCEVDG